MSDDGYECIVMIITAKTAKKRMNDPLTLRRGTRCIRNVVFRPIVTDV